MEAARRVLVSEEEFLALPETMDKIELIDGEVFVAPAPTVRHQWLAKHILFELEAWSRTQNGAFGVGMAPTDIRFAPNRILQPDIYVVRGALPLDVKGPMTTIPFLCVEVLSSDRRHDRVTKRFVYGAAGVEELWIVEDVGLVERWSGPGLEKADEHEDTLTSPLLPGFTLDVKSLR